MAMRVVMMSMVVVVTMIMRMLVRMRVAIGAAFRLEHCIDHEKLCAEIGQHCLQHMVATDAQLFADDLHIGVPVAKVPGEPCERGRTGRSDLDQRLRLAVDAHDRSVIEHEAIAILQADGLGQIKQEPRALNAGQHDAAAMTFVGVENDGIDRRTRVPGSG